jgi:hypothetical protein
MNDWPEADHDDLAAGYRLMPCRACDGSGEVCVGSTPGSWYEPPEGIFEPCPVCSDPFNRPGLGEYEATEPLELEDTLGVLLPEDGLHPYHWPFEPIGAAS